MPSTFLSLHPLTFVCTLITPLCVYINFTVMPIQVTITCTRRFPCPHARGVCSSMRPFGAQGGYHYLITLFNLTLISTPLGGFGPYYRSLFGLRHVLQLPQHVHRGLLYFLACDSRLISFSQLFNFFLF